MPERSFTTIYKQRRIKIIQKGHSSYFPELKEARFDNWLSVNSYWMCSTWFILQCVINSDKEMQRFEIWEFGWPKDLKIFWHWTAAVMFVIETAVATEHLCLVFAQVNLCHLNRYFEGELDDEEGMWIYEIKIWGGTCRDVLKSPNWSLRSTLTRELWQTDGLLSMVDNGRSFIYCL